MKNDQSRLFLIFEPKFKVVDLLKSILFLFLVLLLTSTTYSAELCVIVSETGSEECIEVPCCTEFDCWETDSDNEVVSCHAGTPDQDPDIYYKTDSNGWRFYYKENPEGNDYFIAKVNCAEYSCS